MLAQRPRLRLPQPQAHCPLLLPQLPSSLMSLSVTISTARFQSETLQSPQFPAPAPLLLQSPTMRVQPRLRHRLGRIV